MEQGNDMARKSSEKKNREGLGFDNGGTQWKGGLDSGQAWKRVLWALNPLLWIRVLWAVARSTARALTPKFEAPAQLRLSGGSTAYLDGLRGVAALIVLVHHFSKDPFPWLPWGWGSVRDDVPQHHFLQLPVVRILHSGPSMVAVFFVISGFALSCSPLRYIRRHEQAPLASALASSVFRRAMRLYLPCFVTSLCMVAAIQLRLAPFPSHRPREASILGELWAWLRSMHALANPFDLSFTLPRYDDNLWTIPVEFRGSMVLFAVLLGLSRVRYQARIVLETAITVWLFSLGLWDMSLFIAGLVLAELHFERAAASAHLPNSLHDAPPHSSRRRTLLRILLFLFAIYLASAPLLGFASSTTFSFFSAATPSSWRSRQVADRFLPTIAAPLLVYCVDRSTHSKRFLTSSVGRYLGRVSFALYLVHGPVRYTMYHPLMEAVMRGFGLSVVRSNKTEGKTEVWIQGVKWLGLDHLVGTGKGIDADRARQQALMDADAALQPRFWASIALTWLIVLPITLGLAEWFARVVDDGSVRLARRLETYCTDEALQRNMVEGLGSTAMDESSDVKMERD